MIFKYLFQVNTEKYPEIMIALNEAKKKNGIALYLRQLIEKDVNEKQVGAVIYAAPQEVAATTQQITQPELRNPVAKLQLNHALSQKVDEENDFGGGLA